MKENTSKKLSELVRRNYDTIADDFDMTRKKEIWPQVRELAGEVKDGDKVLDIGCGNGRLLDVFKEKEIDYLGVDNSHKLIALAKSNYPGRDFMIGDISDLSPLNGKQFDYIFCLAVLQHIPGKTLRLKSLTEMKSKLKPGGEIILSVWNLWSPSWKKKNFRGMIIDSYFSRLFTREKLDFGDIIFPWRNSKGEKTSDRYYHAFTRTQLYILAKEAGLSIKKYEKDSYNYWLILS